uniref:Uncharacterized protein n=1 Tax=Timema genevievae TaxID=629358 RepID=A0A7R9JW90_TIMGE|nr:unnamed protein product [Timema genevievae]
MPSDTGLNSETGSKMVFTWCESISDVRGSKLLRVSPVTFQEHTLVATQSKASRFSHLPVTWGSRFKSQRNPSSTSGLSETGSLDRAKAALERRKKASDEGGGGGGGGVQDRVMTTRVDPNTLIAELMSSTNLVQTDESAELSGLQLFIAKDGTTALGSHEVKSQMPAGVFKQVVMDLDNR